MENIEKIKMKVLLVFLSFVSLSFCIVGLFLFQSHSSFHILDFLEDLIALFPVILLIIYLLRFHSERYAAISFSLIFGLIAVTPILSIILSLMRYGFPYFKDFFKYNMEYYLSEYLPIIITFTLATISILKGSSKKTYPFTSLIYALIIQYNALCFYFSYIFRLKDFGRELSMTLIGDIFYALGNLVFYIVLLLFVIKNRIPTVIQHDKKKESIMNPEELLILLNAKLEHGSITEEEYKEQREEIIRNL